MWEFNRNVVQKDANKLHYGRCSISVVQSTRGQGQDISAFAV